MKQKLRLDFIGDNSGNRIYYRCESVKDLATDHLTLLGASSISLKCSGGMEDYVRLPHWAPMSLSAHFEVPVPLDQRSSETVVIKSDRQVHEDCFLNVAFLNKALPLFPGVKVLKKHDSCAHNLSRWSYEVKIMK